MTNDSEEARQAIRALERAGWSDLVDRVIFGVCHGLNGRISALLGLAYLAQTREEGDSLVVKTLEEEVDRVEGLVRLLETVPHDGFWESEAISLAEMLEDLTGLMGRQRGLERLEMAVSVSGDPPPIRMNRTILFRCLLLLLTRVAVSARETGVGRLEIRLSGEEGGAALTFRHGSPEEAPPSESFTPGIPLSLRPELEEEVETVLGGSGGRVEKKGPGPDGAWVKVWLPSLASGG